MDKLEFSHIQPNPIALSSGKILFCLHFSTSDCVFFYNILDLSISFRPLSNNVYQFYWSFVFSEQEQILLVKQKFTAVTNKWTEFTSPPPLPKKTSNAFFYININQIMTQRLVVPTLELAEYVAIRVLISLL